MTNLHKTDPCLDNDNPVQCNTTGNPRPIDVNEVRFAQQEWCRRLLDISRTYHAGGDYRQVAIDFINDLYDFPGRVFFRPTLAQFPNNFRTTFDGTLEYFIGRPGHPEEGFATKKLIAAKYSNRVDQQDPAIQLYDRDGIAVAMGNVCLKESLAGTGGTEVIKDIVVDKVFVYRKVSNCRLKLTVHMSAQRNGPGQKAIE
jgi:hypothetical protein